MVESLKKNRKGIAIMLVSSICVCIGQLLWKLSGDKGIWFVVFGFFFYGIGACAMIIAYKFGSLSVLQPMLCMNYVLSIVLAKIVLSEEITLVRMIGVIVIICGAIFIGGGDKE